MTSERTFSTKSRYRSYLARRVEVRTWTTESRTICFAPATQKAGWIPAPATVAVRLFARIRRSPIILGRYLASRASARVVASAASLESTHGCQTTFGGSQG